MDCVFDPDDILEVRILPARKSAWYRAGDLPRQESRLSRANQQGENIYVGVNPRTQKGGSTAGDVSLARCLCADWDGDIELSAARKRWEAAGLPEPTVVIHSGHGIHAYWRLAEPIADLSEWTTLQKTLIRVVGSDKSIHDPPRIMRLPGFDNCKEDPRVPCRTIDADPARRYVLHEFQKILTPQPKQQNHTSAPAEELPTLECARKYLAKIPGAVSGEHGHDRTFHVACTLVLGFDLRPDEAWPLIAEWNATCQPPWDEPDLRRKLFEADKQTGDRGYLLPQNGRVKLPPSIAPVPSIGEIGRFVVNDPWPEPLRPEAFHGITGDIVQAIEPHSEADPVALLVQLLTGFGNLIGNCAHFRVEGDRHFCKLFTCLVGTTSKGRKGTSWGQIARLFEAVDPVWAESRILSGLSSGEGLIWQVRDPIFKREPIREKGKIVDYQEVEVDPGVTDKRLLVCESEMGSVLRVLRRETNTLSAIVRDAWDKVNLRTLTKNSPAVATGCHISINGHITRNELRRHLTETDMANGFANRFLWICVRRSKCLPEGGTMHSLDVGPFIRRLTEAAEFASNCGELRRDDEARTIWADVYPTLSDGRPGLLGAVTSRAEAQVMRLALEYALLDRSAAIRADHLLAALAVWEYAEASARHIFGSALGDPTADEVLKALRAAPEGLPRSDLRDHFGRHKSSDEIGRALGVLAEAGLARYEMRGTAGRSAEVWFPM